jgi:dTDP-4-dehydrorhamnose 3,5-epimerase
MMQMKISETQLPEVKLIDFFNHTDHRGNFVKTFHASNFANAGIDFVVKESFFSTSAKNVLRGMHFHTEPFAHAKIIFCTQGSILDVAVDVRKESDTFGEFIHINLTAENNKGLYIPKGFAHGFLTLSETATTYYLVDGEYSATSDAGILYSSFGMQWPSSNIITNERDLQFPSLQNL